MVWLGQPVLDAVRITKHVEHMDAPLRCWPKTVLRQIGELDAIIGEHGMDREFAGPEAENIHQGEG